jgi:hypothetical protein
MMSVMEGILAALKESTQHYEAGVAVCARVVVQLSQYPFLQTRNTMDQALVQCARQLLHGKNQPVPFQSTLPTTVTQVKTQHIHPFPFTAVQPQTIVHAVKQSMSIQLDTTHFSQIAQQYFINQLADIPPLAVIESRIERSFVGGKSTTPKNSPTRR